MTPMTARGVVGAAHWTPALRWRIERIKVLHPIRTEWRQMPAWECRRDLVASAQLITADERPVSRYVGASTIDLGWMVYDRDPLDRHAMRYFRPIMRNGIIDVSAIDPAVLPG